MPRSPESMPSPEEQADIETQRVLSDAELIEGGAKYEVIAGKKSLNTTKEQIAAAREEMEDAFAEREPAKRLTAEDVFHCAADGLPITFGFQGLIEPAIEDWVEGRSRGNMDRLLERTKKGHFGEDELSACLQAIGILKAEDFRFHKKWKATKETE